MRSFDALALSIGSLSARHGIDRAGYAMSARERGARDDFGGEMIGDSCAPSLQKTIPATLSLYLDLARFLAAVFVVLYHSWSIFFPSSVIKWPGHEAVVVFFVLSGYVISHAAAQPGITLARYAQHRAARIMPVALLALLLSYVLAAFILPSDGRDPGWPTFANAMFIAQAGWVWIEAPLNQPFWSLNYEVWYYIIFGAWMFSPPKWRKLFTALAMLCAGPKILLLLPVWLMGAWLYRAMPTMSRRVGWIVFLSTLVIAAALWWFDVSGALRSWLYTVFPPAWRAHYSTQFIYDILLGVLVSANFAAVVSLGPAFGFLFKGSSAIRYLATFTFSLYVFHSPLTALLTKWAMIRSPVFFYLLMAILIFALAQLTERRVRFFRALLECRGRSQASLRLPLAK
jgi:peptidoglycan/LPS O-acetylase OafA/YrhL